MCDKLIIHLIINPTGVSPEEIYLPSYTLDVSSTEV